MKSKHSPSLVPPAPINDRDLDRNDAARHPSLSNRIVGMASVSDQSECFRPDQRRSPNAELAIRQAMFLSMFSDEAWSNDPTR